MPGLAPTGRRLLFLLSGLPLGCAWFSLLIALWSATAGLIATPLVLAMFYIVGAATIGMGTVEAWLARELLGARAHPPRWPAPKAGWVRRLLGPVSTPAFWRAQAYLWLRALLGFTVGVLTLALLAASLGLIAAPAYAWAIPEGLDYGVYTARDFGEALPAVPVGLLLLAATIMLAEPMTRPFRHSSEHLLGEQEPTGAQTGGSPAARSGPITKLIVHGWVLLLGWIGLTLIWALAGGGYFWPVWAMLPTGAALALHGWVVLLRTVPAVWRWGPTFSLAIHAGAWLVAVAFLSGVRAAAGGGYFWPAWPALGLGIALAIHASVAVFTSAGRRSLSERIDVLESTRAGAVDAEDERLRAIERDLHDGAQARLVALGMSLGMAEQKLADAEPAAAQELLAEARAGAEHALRELRDLARGIHPPVLTDRGLEAAVRSLADLSPMRVAVSSELGADRPPAAVESALYFVAAEALANAAKHAQANHVDVRMRRDAGCLRLDVVDDGVGGAQPDGSGLSGLRRRVQALDGDLRVTSPPGGPTIVHAELPCA